MEKKDRALVVALMILLAASAASPLYPAEVRRFRDPRLEARVRASLALAESMAVACGPEVDALATDRWRSVARTESVREALDRMLLYQAPPDGPGEVGCGGGVAARTTVGGPVVFVCAADFPARPRRGAVVLLHEALHLAGLGEVPGIDEVVERGCR